MLELNSISKEVFSADDRKQFFFTKSNSRRNVLQIAAMRRNQEYFLQKLLSIFEELANVSADDLRSLLRDVDLIGNNAFQIAVQENTKKVYQVLWKYVSKYFTVDEQRSFLLACGFNRNKIIDDLIKGNDDQTMVSQLREIYRSIRVER